MNSKRNLYVGVSVVVVLLVGALALAGNRGESAETQDPSARTQEMQDMQAGEGMEMGGMSMDGSVRLSAEEVRTFGVTFGMAEVRPLTKTIRTTGIVAFDETRMAYVAPKFDGWAETLHVDFTGQRVREGQPLLEVYSPDLVTAQEELLLAARLSESLGESRVEGVVSGATDLLESAKRRLRHWNISEPQIRRILETGEASRTLTLHAPATGIVMEKDVFEGQAFQAGRNLYMIADLSEVWVHAEVFEADAALVREGMPAEVRIQALPGQAFRGTVEYVYPTLGEQTRSMKARISFPNPRRQIKPGMYATVTFTAELGDELAIPSSAVLYTGEAAVAFVDAGGGNLLPRELTLGVEGERSIQVLDGLEPGDRIVTSAQFLLDSESNLAEVMQAMMVEMGMTDMDMDMGGMESMDGTGMGDRDDIPVDDMDVSGEGMTDTETDADNGAGAGGTAEAEVVPSDTTMKRE